MAHLALYREWRPKTFDEVVEQKHAVHALRQSVISGQIAHAYLFSGTRGTGKTTMAKIFSRAINCLQPVQGNPCNQCEICRAALDGSLMDIIEMDAASNNSVDNIRRICDEIVFMPSQARYKVYIIDEVHMLSAGAFNALLKTLEEPPSHAVFILATTEPHRIPATILSRCQRYEFRRIPLDSMIQRLDQIAHSNAIEITPEALKTIASLADGALRDAISILDQARSAFVPPITHDHVLNLVGVVRDQFLQQVAEALIAGDLPELLKLVDQLIMAGRDQARFVTDLAQHLRNLLICQVAADDRLLVRVHSEALADMKKLAERVQYDRLISLIRGLSALLTDLRWAADSRTTLEIGLIRLMDTPQPAAAQERQTVATTALSGQLPTPPAPPDTKPAKTTAAQNAKPTAPPAVQNSQSTNQPLTQNMKRPDTTVTQTIEPAQPPLPEPPPETDSWTDEPFAEAETADEAEAETADETAPAATVSADVSADDTADVTDLWNRVLDDLQKEGQMTLYLFCRPARPVLCDRSLRLIFSPGDTVHYQEASQPVAQKVLNDSLRRLSGQDWSVAPELAQNNELAACPEKKPDDWVEKVRSAARALGIPMNVEDA